MAGPDLDSICSPVYLPTQLHFHLHPVSPTYYHFSHCLFIHSFIYFFIYLLTYYLSHHFLPYYNYFLILSLLSSTTLYLLPFHLHLQPGLLTYSLFHLYSHLFFISPFYSLSSLIYHFPFHFTLSTSYSFTSFSQHLPTSLQLFPPILIYLLISQHYPFTYSLLLTISLLFLS